MRKHGGLVVLLLVAVAAVLLYRQFAGVSYLSGDGGLNELGALNG